jgi:hypothetical protein
MILLAAVVASTAAPISSTASSQTSVTVHEWGTFTSIAGADGRAVEWLPQNGSTDLPCFVDRLGPSVKAGLVGTVRMETPVLYFYAADETIVDVRVRFPQGLITEWYPRAKVTPVSITWSGVRILPNQTGDFPVEDGANHYYAARHTDAAAIETRSQWEKFLFYRGVGRFPPPLAATIAADGTVLVRNLGHDAIPDVVLVDSHNGSISYQALHNVSGHTSFDAVVPADESPVRSELESILVANGLFAREAAAMIETWGDSWFEDGTRVFYIVPASAIDAILPLDVTPRPASVARVFVGRMELVTAETERVVKTALTTNDRNTLRKYGRFLQAIGNRVIADSTPFERPMLSDVLQRAYSAMLPATACRTTTN